MDANTYYLNQHLAQMDAQDALDEFRNEQAAEIMDDLLTGKHEDYADFCDDVVGELFPDYEGDAEVIVNLILQVNREGSETMKQNNRKYFDVVEEMAAKRGDEEASSMTPDYDPDY